MEFKVHWWAPLQPKGFLKIIEFFLAIIAFSLVAGFSVSTSVDFTCLSSGTYNYSLKISYPFKEIKQSEMGVTDDNVIIDTESMKSFEDRGVPRAAQYFVAWGVLTLFYCIIALAVYMLVTANEQWEKAFDFLVVTDVVFHVVWILCWFIASVDWAVAFHRIDSVLKSYMDDLKNSNCGGDENVTQENSDSIIYVQAQIAVVFGFLIQFVWAINIGWLVIDTSWYINWRASRGHSTLSNSP